MRIEAVASAWRIRDATAAAATPEPTITISAFMV
jgi:hypothetical protein